MQKVTLCIGCPHCNDISNGNVHCTYKDNKTNWFNFIEVKNKFTDKGNVQIGYVDCPRNNKEANNDNKYDY